MHLDNNIAWLKALEEQRHFFKNIRGLVITGWQRYDHLATLCELLPVNDLIIFNNPFNPFFLFFLFKFSPVFHP